MMTFHAMPKRAMLPHDVDLEMLAPELLASRHPGFISDPAETTRAKARMRVLRIDTNGNSSILDMKRSDILKIAHDAAARPVVATGDVDGAPKRQASPRKSRMNITASAGYHSVQLVNMRDLRKLDINFASSNDPCIMLRKQAILINTESIRAILTRDTCLIMLGESSEAILPTLKEKLHELIRDKDSQDTAFEFRALEAILFTICKHLFTNATTSFPKILHAVERLASAQISAKELESLRTQKNTINDFNSQVEGIRRVLADLLDNDSDLRLLYLSQLHEDPEVLTRPILFDPEEAEVLLESYLQEMHTLRTKIRLLQQRIQNTESLVMLKLDSTRNHLLTVDVLFNLLTMGLTFGMFVPAVFGMNLHTGFESEPHVFTGVVLCSMGLCLVIVSMGVLYFRRRGVTIM